MESCNAAISIGGKIKRSAVAELAAALAHDRATIDWIDCLEDGELVDHILGKVAAKDHLYFCNNEHPWGQYETTEAFCRQHGLIYVLEYEAGGDWSPGMEYRSPGMEPGKVREWPISEIGRGPLIDAEDIQKHLDGGTLADEIALMAAVHKFPWPLQIVEDEDLQAAAPYSAICKENHQIRIFPMTYEQALRRLDRVADYLKNLLDTQHHLSNEEIESLISDIDAVQEGLQQGLTQVPNPDE